MSDGELVRHFGGVAEIEKVRHVDGDFGIVFKHISEGYRAGCSWLQFRQIRAGIGDCSVPLVWRGSGTVSWGIYFGLA